MTTDEPVRRPLYARALRLRHLRPSGLWCFVFFEGMIALGVLLALTELVSWWAVLVLPASVAVMVKVNDVLAGAWANPPAPPATPPAAGPPARPGWPAQPPGVRQVSRDLTDTLDPAHSIRQRFRQSARRRYQ
ncbi:MAG TPA: hypothetical protein VIL37_02320 [Natronosporangium sp.]